MSISASGAITQVVWVGDKQHGRAKVVLPNGCEAHGNFVAGKREGLWLVVGPPNNGNLMTQTLWKEGQLVRFVDDGGAISLPLVSILTLLDTTNLWLSHQRPLKGSTSHDESATCSEKSIIN